MTDREKKYELIESDKVRLYRVKALRSFSDVNKGDIGGYVQSEGNLSQKGDAWVYGNAEVSGKAKVYGDAWVCDNAKVSGKAKVYGDAEVFGNAEVCDNAGYIVFKNWWSSGRYFTWTRSNNLWKVGFFFGTGEELIKMAYKDSEQSGREYERIVKYVEEIIKEAEK